MRDDDNYIDITPPTRLLHSLRAGGPPNYTVLAGEAIDNAFDAGSTSVKMTIGDTEIRFKDNGQGVLPDKIGNLYTPGGHHELETSRLGRYGVGITKQALRCGETLAVRSVSAGGQISARGNWATILRSNSWRIPKPRPIPVAVGTPTGTEIIISDLLEAKKYSIEDLRRDTAMMFRPALVDREIIINGIQLQPIPDPTMTEVVTAEHDFDLDRSMTVIAGLIDETAPLKLVHVGFEHRVIFFAKRIGCGTYHGVSSLYANVQLQGKWKLGEFKDDLYDEGEKRELETALEGILYQLLERCEEKSRALRHEQLIIELNNLVPEKITAARPHRNTARVAKARKERQSTNNNGAVDMDKSDLSTTGPARAQRRTPAKLLIEIEPGRADSIGEFDASSKIHRVILYSNNPAVAAAIDQRGRDRRSLYGLMSHAGSLYFRGLDDELTLGRQHDLPNVDGTFGERMAWFLANITAKVNVLSA